MTGLMVVFVLARRASTGHTCLLIATVRVYQREALIRDVHRLDWGSTYQVRDRLARFCNDPRRLPQGSFSGIAVWRFPLLDVTQVLLCLAWRLPCQGNITAAPCTRLELCVA